MVRNRGLVLLLFIPSALSILLVSYHAHSYLPPSLAAVWYLLWMLRTSNDALRRQDLILFLLIITLYLYQDSSWRAATFTVCVLCIGYLSMQWSRPKVTFSASDSQYEGHEMPRVHPCRTTHARMFPKKHAFSHSYLQVSIPVDFDGNWGLVSAGSTLKKSWFHVQASDYLDRGSSVPSLKAKLSAYLESQGVSSSEWHQAFLVTAPRFLGYSFNPVSFWYIYNEDRILVMMVLEVNNTFDERRMYLLKRTRGQTSDDDSAVAIDKRANGRFKNAWPKDFHVSPFNSRNGSYTLSAVDLLHDGCIDNTIVLKSSKDSVKLVARIFSEGPSVDPKQLSNFQKTLFILRWFWVGFATFPRILKEAAALFFRRKLHVWYRPEVLPDSIGRNPTSAEIVLESFFVRYLEDIVKRSSTNFEVTYDPGLPDSYPRIFRSAGRSPAFIPVETLHIKVLSPAFFSRFVYYAHTTEAFDRENIFTDEKNRTIWVSKPVLLPNLLATGAGASQHPPLNGAYISWKWKLVERLRCSPPARSYRDSPQTVDIQDIRAMSLSPLDTFLQTNCYDAGLYRKHCIRLFLAQRFAFGYPEIIDGVDFLLRAELIWLGVSAIMTNLVVSAPTSSIFLLDTWLLALSNVVRTSLVHLWAFLKSEVT